jgi:hypothetical protein
MIRVMILLLLLTACTSCSEFALLASGSSVAITQNVYARAYSGVDVLTIIKTDKDIKTHLYENIRKDRNDAEVE